MNKFTMELVWHNCCYYPPREDFNSSLYVTDGFSLFEAKYSSKIGWDAYGYYGHIRNEDLDKWWWADIAQTVQKEQRFKDNGD